MRTLPPRLGWLAAAVLLAGCDAQISRVQDSANHMRIGLERMADASRAADESREAQIIADGEAIVRKDNQLTGQSTLQDTANYALRRDAAGWSIIDLRTQQPVRRSGQSAKGLPLSRARDMLENLESDDDPTGSYSSRLLPPRR